MDYLTRIVYLIMLISSTRGTQTPHDSSSNTSANNVISSGKLTTIHTETSSSTTQTAQNSRDVPEVMGTTTSACSTNHLLTPTNICNTHTPKLLNKTSIDGCEYCIVGNKWTQMFISCAVNGTNKPSMYLGGSERTLHENLPGLWNYLLPAHRIAEHHNDTIICNVTDPSTNTALEDTARFYVKIENRPSLTFTQANGSVTVLCMAKGRPTPKLKILYYPSSTSYNVTTNVTTPPSGDEEMYTRKIEFLYTCTPASSGSRVKCCDDHGFCTRVTRLLCPWLPPIPHGSTDGVTLDDTSSASTTAVITTYFSNNHTGLADRGETKQWLLPVTIVATVVGAVIVMVVIAFLISLTPSRASKQQDSVYYENIMERTINVGGPRSTSIQQSPESGLNQLNTDVDYYELIQINRE